MIKKYKFTLISSFLGLVLLYSSLYLEYSTPGLRKYKPYSLAPTKIDIKARSEFLETRDPKTRYDQLTRYFLEGFVKNASPSGALVNYPGLPSKRGYHVSGVEGFARTAPLIAAWLNSRDSYEVIINGVSVDFVQYLRRAVLAGTSPKSPDYWGDIEDYNQRIVEASDIAKLLWLTRSYIWNSFSVAEKKQVKKWLSSALSRKTPPNNWLLFQTITRIVLDKLEGQNTSEDYPPYQQFKSYYTESGWFFDAPHGFDYYNTWGIPYDLFWITWVDPEFDTTFIRQAIKDSSNLTMHLISPNGVPMMGRSVCYRTAISVPLLAQSLLEKPDENVALRGLDAIWRYFVDNNILIDGTITQGYLETNPYLLDLYSGPGSCHWGLRSLVLAWMQPETFWNTLSAKLPIEKGGYFIELEKIGWIIEGKQEKQEITITIPSNNEKPITLKEASFKQNLKGWLLRQPVRPKNKEYKYRKHTYSSADPI